MPFFSVGSISELKKSYCFMLVGIPLSNWIKVLSQFPSLPGGQVTLNNDNFKVDRKSLMDKVTGAITTMLLR